MMLNAYLSDTILNSGVESEVYLLKPPCEHLGERTAQRAKSACQNSASYLPVYRCSIYRRASPFGNVSDPDLIKPCPCESYQPTSLATCLPHFPQ